MNATEIIQAVKTAGLQMMIADDGNLSIRGCQDEINRLLPTIRNHKPEIVAALRATHPALDADLHKRILAMAERWQYSSDELAIALRDAAVNPAGWLLAVACDESNDWSLTS